MDSISSRNKAVKESDFQPVLNQSGTSKCRVGVLAYCTEFLGVFGAQNTVDTPAADGRFISVTLKDGDVAMPTAQFLLDNFDVIITMTDNKRGLTIPQNIADSAEKAVKGFAQGGGELVLSTFIFSNSIGFGNEIFLPELSPFEKVQCENTAAGQINIKSVPGDPLCKCLLEGVTAPVSSTFANAVTLSKGAILCASYENEQPLLAVNPTFSITGLNTFPAFQADNAQASYRRLVSNAVYCAFKKSIRGLDFYRFSMNYCNRPTVPAPPSGRGVELDKIDTLTEE